MWGGGHQHPKGAPGLGWSWALSFLGLQSAGRMEGKTQPELGLILLPEQCKHLLGSCRRLMKASQAQGAEQQRGVSRHQGLPLSRDPGVSLKAKAHVTEAA